MSHGENPGRNEKQPHAAKRWWDLSARGGNISLPALTVALAACLFAFFQAVPLRGQSSKSKLPIFGKLTSHNHQQAFTGKVQSLDLKQRVLSVNSLHGQDDEIFPVKKTVHVEAINGHKMNLTELAPGMTVLIYFDQNSGKRTVKDIIVLSSSKNRGKGKQVHST